MNNKEDLLLKKGMMIVDSFNFSLEEDPQMVKIGKFYTKQEIKEILHLLAKYKDAIAWSYQDLITFDPNIIMHDFPLN